MEAPQQKQKMSKFTLLRLFIFGVVVFCLTLLFKIPEAKIQNYVIAQLRIISQQQGLYFSAEKVKIGILLGPSVKLYNVKLKSIESDKKNIDIPYLKIKPQLFSLLSDLKKAHFDAELLEGEISGSVGFSNTSVTLDITIKNIKPQTSSLVTGFLPAQLTCELSGNIDLSLNPNNALESNGVVQIQSTKLQIQQQSIYGFNIPEIKIGDVNLDLSIATGKISVKTLALGKDIKKDDIVAKATADGLLANSLMSTNIKGKVSFEVSSKLIQSFPLLESLISDAKGPNNQYRYHFEGPLYGLDLQPGE